LIDFVRTHVEPEFKNGQLVKRVFGIARIHSFIHSFIYSHMHTCLRRNSLSQAWQAKIHKLVVEHGGYETAHAFQAQETTKGDEIYDDSVKQLLQIAKAKYDPTNVFTFNKNITPAGKGTSVSS
jgi:FAD/FMN-containing dehydrogenase